MWRWRRSGGLGLLPPARSGRSKRCTGRRAGISCRHRLRVYHGLQPRGGDVSPGGSFTEQGLGFIPPHCCRFAACCCRGRRLFSGASSPSRFGIRREPKPLCLPPTSQAPSCQEVLSVALKPEGPTSRWRERLVSAPVPFDHHWLGVPQLCCSRAIEDYEAWLASGNG
jgi:hypothetical protein